MNRLFVFTVILYSIELFLLRTDADVIRGSFEDQNELEQDYQDLEVKKSGNFVPSDPKFIQFYSFPNKRYEGHIAHI